MFWLFDSTNGGVLSLLSLPGRIPQEFQKFWDGSAAQGGKITKPTHFRSQRNRVSTICWDQTSEHRGLKIFGLYALPKRIAVDCMCGQPNSGWRHPQAIDGLQRLGVQRPHRTRVPPYFELFKGKFVSACSDGRQYDHGT